MSGKKFSPFDECLCFVCIRTQNKQKNSVRLSVCLSVSLDVGLDACLPVCLAICLYFRLSVCLSVRTWTFDVDTITFEGVNGSEQNLVGVCYVKNVGLILKFKVKL